MNSSQRTTKVGSLVHIGGGGGRVTFTNSFVDGRPIGFGAPLIIDNTIPTETLRQQLPVHIKVEREFSWVEFRFPGTPVDALSLIKEAHLAISQFANELKDALPK